MATTAMAARPLVAVTGHRMDKLGGYTPSATSAVLRTARWALSDLRPSHVITGMALGWDQAIAEACIDLNIPFTAAVPFEGQELRWPAESQRTYSRLLRQAAHIHHVCEPGYAAWKMQKCNQWMVDQLTSPDALLVALWDGTDGGTANCVRYAESRSIPYRNAWPAYLYFKENSK